MSKAVSVSDVLAVQRELSYVTQEIEGKKATLQYYDQHASLSTVNVRFKILRFQLIFQR